MMQLALGFPRITAHEAAQQRAHIATTHATEHPVVQRVQLPEKRRPGRPPLKRPLEQLLVNEVPATSTWQLHDQLAAASMVR